MRRQGYYPDPKPNPDAWRTRQGLHVGLVLAVNPATAQCDVELTDGARPVPATVCQPNASSTNGFVWLPKPGDLVVIGYADSHQSMPVILGSVYAVNDTLHAQDPGDLTIRHQSGSRISILNDGTIEIVQASGALMRLDTAGDVALKDATGNVAATMTAAAITLDADSGGGGARVEIDASGGILITPGAGGSIALAGSVGGVMREGDVTSSPFGGSVADHYHVLVSGSTKVTAG